MDLTTRIAALLASISSFAKANPIFMTAIVWPVVTGILNSLLRKRTEEEREELRRSHPRYAEVVRIIGALGLDPKKALEAIKNLVLGSRDDDKKPPTPPAVIGALVVACLVTPVVGCTPQARAQILESIARKIECGIVNQDLPDNELIAKCAVQPEDVKAVLDAVGKSRAVGADHAYAAASIAKKDAADKCEAAGAFRR